MSRLRVLVVAALGLTFVVIVVGAYVRLSDAGLGCPDWPCCYGHPMPRTSRTATRSPRRGRKWATATSPARSAC